MKNKNKIILIVVLILFVIGILYLAMELFYPREVDISGTFGAKNDEFRLEKSEKNNRYYVNFLKNNKKIEMECSKTQYDLLSKDVQYYIVYRENFFNRNKGKILTLDNNPIHSN